MREDGLTSVISPDQEISSGRVLSSRFSEVLLVQHKQEIARHRMYEMRMVRSHGFTSWAMFHGGSGAASVPIADVLCQCSSVHANRSDRERVDPRWGLAWARADTPQVGVRRQLVWLGAACR